jgi:hypothetical protein
MKTASLFVALLASATFLSVVASAPPEPEAPSEARGVSAYDRPLSGRPSRGPTWDAGRVRWEVFGTEAWGPLVDLRHPPIIPSTGSAGDGCGSAADNPGVVVVHRGLWTKWPRPTAPARTSAGQSGPE